jgi:hypothetical protein
MATCPSGHESASDDFCDVCGIKIAATGATGAPPAEPCPRCGTERAGQFCENCGYNFVATAASVATSQPPPEQPLPTHPLPAQPSLVQPIPGQPSLAQPPPAAVPSAAPRTPVMPPVSPPAPDQAATWTAVVAADRDYYDRMRAEGDFDTAAIGFPPYCPERRFRLSGTEVRIGRRSTSRGLVPEIDLTGPPADPGVSRLHAVLLSGPDGTWSVLDPGSANGTLVNDSEVPRDEAVPLGDGDRIHLGAWTRITISRD